MYDWEGHMETDTTTVGVPDPVLVAERLGRVMADARIRTLAREVAAELHPRPLLGSRARRDAEVSAAAVLTVLHRRGLVDLP